MKNILIGIVIFFIGFACAFAITHGLAQAQGSADNGDVMGKLNEIAKGQAEITAAINEIKMDIQIIKVRVTQNQ